VLEGGGAVISGFTFVFNAIEGGYPVAEAIAAVRPFVGELVAVDMGSTDGTRVLLERLGCRVLDGPCWGEGAVEEAFAMEAECRGETVVHFQADEVYDRRLLEAVLGRLDAGARDLRVHRIQVEQNFQRVRWYPYPVHRVWRRGTVRPTHGAMTTDRDGEAETIPPEEGLLWDCAACFRGNWAARRRNQAAAWRHQRCLRVARHFAEPNEYTDEVAFLAEPQWAWTRSPLDLPDVLKPLVGMERYRPSL